MGLCVLDEFVLNKSRHRIEGDSVTALLSSLTCENEEGSEECIYWVQLFNSEGNPVMKEALTDFINAYAVYEKLKNILGESIS